MTGVCMCVHQDQHLSVVIHPAALSCACSFRVASPLQHWYVELHTKYIIYLPTMLMKAVVHSFINFRYSPPTHKKKKIYQYICLCVVDLVCEDIMT